MKQSLARVDTVVATRPDSNTQPDLDTCDHLALCTCPGRKVDISAKPLRIADERRTRLAGSEVRQAKSQQKWPQLTLTEPMNVI